MEPQRIELATPLSPEDVSSLRTGDRVILSGVIYTARDAAHKRMWDAVEEGVDLPFDPEGQIVYYVGPTPAPPGRVIGSAGPTTAGRMDPYAPLLIERGLRGMIGKGKRSVTVREAMKRFGCVYFGAVEGTAALLSGHIKKSELIDYEDLGTEAIRRLTVEDFPAIVVNDIHGGDLYEEGQRRFQKKEGLADMPNPLMT